MTSEVPENLNENKNDYPKKKYLDINENKEDIDDCIKILTNLTKLDLNQDAINGIYLFGCDLSEETEPSEENASKIRLKNLSKIIIYLD